MAMKQDGSNIGWRFGDGMGYYFSKEGQDAQYFQLRRGYMRGQQEFDNLENLTFVHEFAVDDMVPEDVVLMSEERGFIMGWAARAHDAAQGLSKTPLGDTTKPGMNLPIA